MSADVEVTALPWDSEFWGTSVGRVHLDDDRPASVEAVRDALCRSQQLYDFVHVLVPAAQIAHAQTAQRAGFLLVDARCEVVLDRAAHEPSSPHDLPIEAVTGHDVERVADLAATCHLNSRFGVDPFLDRTRVEELYRQWIRRDASTPGWVLAGVEHGEHVVGYVTFGRTTDGDGSIGLIGVAPEARGQRIGPKLVGHAVQSLFAAGAPRVSVITQAGSRAAMRMYQAGGFDVARLGYWLHWHRT